MKIRKPTRIQPVTTGQLPESPRGLAPALRSIRSEATLILSTPRNIQRAVALAMLGSLNLYAQLVPASKPAVQTPMLVETGPHQRAWQRVATDLRTTNRPDTGRRVVEITTGMNYWDGRQWVPSDPSFEITEDAFVAERLQLKVRLKANLNTIGAVSITTPDGIRLHSTPVGIGLYDAASGQSAIIGVITDCAGVLIGNNRVVYENAFKGVCADVVYTIERGTFEQDVVITGRLDPADYGFPTHTTRIRIFSEFYDTPHPERMRRPFRVEQRQAVRNRMVNPDLVDEVLGFGEFVLATGRAYTAAKNSSDAAAPVAKEFITIAGRTLLIESVEYKSVQGELQLLADCATEHASNGEIPKVSGSKVRYAELPTPPPDSRAKVASNRTTRRVANAAVGKRAGVVIDYIATLGGTMTGRVVFRGDTTYLVSGAVFCNGPTTIEGGAVFKYRYLSPATAYIKLNSSSSITCKTSSYRPAIFTAVDDDSVGESMNGYTGSGYTGIINPSGYANPALWVSYLSSSTLTNLHFRYAQEAIYVEGSSGSTIGHVQLVNCIRGIKISDGGTVYGISTNCGPVDTVWVDDTVPAGATQVDEFNTFNPWTWVTSSPDSFSASQAHPSIIAAGLHQHYFYNATATLSVNPGDIMVAYVYIDPANRPTEIMLQWSTAGSWEHRAYWGANHIFPGVESAANRYMGGLPAAGQWIGLEVPASLVGLEGTTLDGMAFTLHDGKATWDYAGKKGGNFCYDTDSDGIPDYKEPNPMIGWSSSLSGALASASPVQVVVSVANVNTPPGIGVPTTPPPEFFKGGPAVLIDPAATVTDPDSTSFDAAVLTVAVSGFATEDDRLAIRHQGTDQIGVTGNTVTYGGLSIGTFSGGVGFSALVVQFNSGATLTAVQALLRNLTYQNVLLAAEPGPRTVRLVLTDGDGGTSLPATKTINVVCPGIDVMLVIDRSGSMNQPVSAPAIVAAKLAARQFASYLDFTKDQCGVVSFAGTASSPIDQTLTTSFESIAGKIEAISTSSGTRIDLGIDAAKVELTSPRRRAGNLPVMVVLTDGQNNNPPGNGAVLTSAHAAKALPTPGIRVISIGLGVGIDTDTLSLAASSPADFYVAPTPDQLAAKYAEIAANLCRLSFARPVISAGPDKVVHLPGTATLEGSVTEDGNTRIFNLIWSVARVDGPGSVVFANACAAVTTATFSSPGEYVLRLTGRNPEFSGSDDMVVSVYEDTGENQAPQVRAYPVERVRVGGSTTLKGTVQDDGLPAGSTVTQSWEQVAGVEGGPAQVNPANPSQLEPTVGPFPVAGRYLYRLTASDGQLSASDDVMVTVCNGDAGPVDVVLVMDNSGSMGDSATAQEDPNGVVRFVRARTGAKTFLDFVNPATDQVGLVQFSSVPTLASELTSDMEVVRTAITQMGRVLGSTDIASALYAAWGELISRRHRPGSTPVVVLLSDGYPDDAIAALTAANQLKNAGVRIVTIALVPADQTLARDFLRTISSSIDDAYAGVTTAELSRIYASIAESFCLGQNRRPLVGIEGPPELLINRGDALRLLGTATDDGVPGGALTYQWTLSGVYDGCDHRFAIGSGTATFAASAAQQTDVTFSDPGYYVLRFSAYDLYPDSGSYAEVGVLVNDVPSVTAGASQTFAWTGSEIVAPLSGSVSSDSVSGPLYFETFSETWLCPGLDIRWSLVSGHSSATIENDFSLDFALAHLAGPGRYVVRLSVDDGYAASSADLTLTVLPENSVDAGADQTGSVGTAVSLSDAATNPEATTLVWSKQEGSANPTFSNPNVLHPTVTFPVSGSYILRLTATFGGTTVYDELTARIGTASVQAGPDITIPQGGTAALSGTAVNASGTDLPAQWSVVSAPSGGQVTFADASSKATMATFSLAGTYQLRLRASSGADDLLVFVNQPPIADAGPDQTVVKDKPAELTGSIVADDLLPPNALAAVTWSKLSGPGPVTFQSVHSLKTFARFSAEGVYVLKLSVSDSHLSGDDTLSVKVVTPPLARNDVFLLEEGNEPFILDVLRNDTDPEGDPLTILNYDTNLGADSSGSTIWTAGTLAPINNDTQFQFVPDPGARYTWFFYRIGDQYGGESGYATVVLQIVPPPHAPKAKSDVLYTTTTAVDEWLPVLENDDDGGYGPLSILSYTPLKEINGAPGYGTLSLRAERILSDPEHPFLTQQLMFTADPAQPGIYTFTYTVRNQKGATSTGAVTLVVEPASDPNSAPIVDAGDDQEIYINQSLSLAGIINNDPWDWIQSVVWSSASPNVIFDDTADPATAVRFTAPGDYSLRLMVTDGGENTAFDEVFVRVRPEGRPPVAEIFNLANDPQQLKPDPVITEGLFELRGRATDPNPANAIAYRIGLYQPATLAGAADSLKAWLTPNGDAQGKRALPGLQRITGEAGDDLLGQLDFTRFPNGVYILRLQVWGGSVTTPATAEVRFALNSELRLGRVTFSEEDLAISASGFPMRLIRSYDSTAGNGPDFGWGWKYELKDLDVQLDEERRDEDFIDDDTGFWTSANVRSGGGRNVTLTLPDGRRVTYRFGLRVSITTGYAYAEYTRPPGVHPKLLPKGDNRLVFLLSSFSDEIEPFWQDGSMQTPMDMYEFPGFILKMENGTEYDLDAPPLFRDGIHLPDDTFINPRAPLRLSQIVRPNGEKMVHTAHWPADDAVETCDSQGNRRQTLVLKRDGAGRITKAIDTLSTEAQPTVEYIYDTSGRLWKVRRLVDRPANRYDVTTHFYENSSYPYHITHIEDPRQVNRTRFQYFPDGKLEKIIQPGGAETVFQHDLAGMKETITDPVGTQTVHSFDPAGRITETEVKDTLENRLSKVMRGYDTATTFLTSESVFLRSIGQTDFYANTSFEYDPDGNVNKITDPNRLSTSFTYNSLGQVTTATDPRQRTSRNDYDGHGNLVDATDAEAGNTHNTFVNDRLESSSSPAGALTTYTYYSGETGGSVGDLKTVTLTEWDPVLNENVTLSKTIYTYDANSNVQTERQERKTGTATWSPVQALITSYSYDAQNRVLLTRVQADPPDPQVDSTSSMSYNSIGKVETSTDRLGRVTRYNYDARGNLVQTEYPGSDVYPVVPVSIARTVYDAAGRACYIQNQHEKPTSGNASTAPGRRLIHDGLGRVVRTEQLDNLTIELTSSGTDPSLVYATRILTTTTTPAAPAPTILAASETRYDVAGRVYQTAERRLHPSGDPNLEEDRSVTTHAYDDAGRRTASSVALDDETGQFVDGRLVAQYVYDDAGNLTSVTDALHTETEPRVTEYEYDDVNRRVLTRFPQAGTETTRATRLVEYDKAGRRVAETDELNRTTQFKYDGLGRLIQVTDPELRVTNYKYDWTGNLLEQTDALNHTTTYRDDALGRRVRRTLPGEQFESYSYDAEGNRLTQTDFERKTTTFTYDVLKRLRKITPDAAFAGETPVQFEHFANGRRRQMIDASGQTDYDYDGLGRLKLKTTPRGRITYTYNDTSGRRSVAVTTANQNGSGRTGLGGTSVTYKWNSLGQLASVTDTAGTTTYDYDAVGSLENVNYPIPAAGAQTHYIYDARNRLKEMTVGSVSLARYLYDVGANGRRTRATESGTAVNTPSTRTVDYSYDNLDRLKSELIAGDEAGKDGEFAYTYDDAGNRTWHKAEPFDTPGTTSTFDMNDRLGLAANYDENGNTLVSGGSSYEYDFQNRLKGRTGGAEVVYDGDGNLASRTLGGVTTYYLVDDQNPTGHAQVLEELADDLSQVRKRYTWGLQLISQMDDTLPMDDQVSYSGLDGHGNVRFLLKADGTARDDRYVYDSFGRMIRGTGTTPNVYLYCGERWDSELGLYYLRARYLDPGTGRFMTMDTFEGAQSDPLSLHKYLYAADNPVNMVDPSGQESLKTKLGKEVHKKLGEKFTGNGTIPLRFFGPSIATIGAKLKLPIPPKIQVLFPDLLDANLKEVYEIKPLTGYGLATGFFQALGYVSLLNQIDPSGGWHLGSTWSPPNFLILTSGVAYVSPAVGGVIFYEAMTIQDIAKRGARTVRMSDQNRLQQHMGIATILSTLGGF